jgi:hypothetical protein
VLGSANPAYWTAQTADADRLRCRGLQLDWQGFDGYAAKLEARGPAFNVAMLTPLAAARQTTTDLRAFLGTEMRKGAYGVAADEQATAAEVSAAALVVRPASGILTMPLALIANNDPIWKSVTAAAGRVFITRTWTPAMSPAMLLMQIRDISYGASVNAAFSPYTDDDQTIRDGMRLGGLLFTSATPPVPCGAATLPPTRGAFPHLFGHLARDRATLPLPVAITHSSFLPATIAGIDRRGLLAKDQFADVIVFDPDRIGDDVKGQPSPAAGGPDYVIVNGVVTVTPTGLTGARAGEVLRRRPSPPPR